MDRTKNALNTFVGIHRTADYLEQIVKNDVKRYGLNITEFAVMELLFHKGDQPIQRIGKKVLIASSSITYVVDKLEKKGYVKRLRLEKDRRVIYASLTDEGHELMASVFPHHAETLDNAFSVLTDEELLNLQNALKKLSRYTKTNKCS
ncbi:MULTISPECIES: MarR family winged helix-turn-helix transcriptional regulator [Staphylococcus]|uniref:MarR family transcriptional regulator n=1 Tax=Staphylococcus hsinchuensis TaxID=3051183 RepID=A0ABZ3EDX9_9STAP|nr:MULTISPECIES: MarR family transcriptional regulator [unclassified Staphylococcus]